MTIGVRFGIACVLLLPAMAGSAQPAGPLSAATLAERAAKRFPQPVRVGDLTGRLVLQPVEQQHVLGRVAGIARGSDGGVLVVITLGGVLGVGARPVAVPVEATALLGEYVEVVDFSPEQLRALPSFDMAGAAIVPPSETIRVGVVRPSH